MVRYSNHGYIGYNASGISEGIISPGDLYLRSLPTPITAEGVNILEEPVSVLQAGTLAFANSLRIRVAFETDPTEPEPLG